MNKVQGEGIVDTYKTIKNVANRLIFGDNALPENIIKFLKENGNAKLISGNINRKPISNMINKVLNVLSLNQFQTNLDQTPYDTLFHLSLDIRLTNGIICKIEKNERITTTQIYKIDINSSSDLNITLPNITYVTITYFMLNY